MAISFATGVIKANNPDSLSEFGGNVTLSDMWNVTLSDMWNVTLSDMWKRSFIKYFLPKFCITKLSCSTSVN